MSFNLKSICVRESQEPISEAVWLLAVVLLIATPLLIRSTRVVAAPTPSAAEILSKIRQGTNAWTPLTPSNFSLRNLNQSGDYTDIITDLKKLLTVRPVDQLDLNRTAIKLSINIGTDVKTVEHYNTGFRWESGDESVEYWIPQGVTGTADATSTGMTDQGKKMLVVSWYYDETETDPDAPDANTCEIPCQCNSLNSRYGDAVARDKGVRLSFIDATNMDSIKYRHVLLVEPFRHDDGTPDFCPVPIHAGGLAWVNHYLYVVDTDYGLRVFDTNSILQVSTGDKTMVGKHGLNYLAFDYQYVLPQVNMFESNDTSVRFSYVSLDRSTTPISLITGEYCKDSNDEECTSSDKGRVFRWQLADTGALKLTKGAAVAVEAYASNMYQIQGALSYGGRFWMTKSDGQGNAGTLYCVTSNGTSGHKWGDGPEDLHYSPLSDNLWNLTEWAGQRTVFCVKLSDYTP